jgi:hypothetical protein
MQVTGLQTEGFAETYLHHSARLVRCVKQRFSTAMSVIV